MGTSLQLSIIHLDFGPVRNTDSKTLGTANHHGAVSPNIEKK